MSLKLNLQIDGNMIEANWTNACEIFRDLAVAQGDVPVRVEGTLTARDKPPALNLKEETEEEYFLCSGGGAVVEAPDLGLIQEMLDMVRDKNISDDELEGTIPVITKPSSTPLPVEKPMVKEIKEKKKRRNIALESLIGIDLTPKNDIKLLKPEDLMTKPKNVDPDLITVEASIDKVTGWLLSNEGTSKTNNINKKPVLSLEPPTNMFRKKKSKSPNESIKENCSIKTDSNSKSPSQSQSKEFIPSSYATEYCNKLKEKAKLKENMVDDIWTRAEKEMKRIDEKKKIEAEIAAVAKAESATNETPTIMDGAPNEENKKSPRDPREMLELPGHRHLLTDNCVVCQAFTDFGYSFCKNNNN